MSIGRRGNFENTESVDLPVAVGGMRADGNVIY